jgi:hypothetical protein
LLPHPPDLVVFGGVLDIATERGECPVDIRLSSLGIVVTVHIR